MKKELAKRMPNPYYLTDRAIQVGFIISLDGHHVNHANSILFVRPNYPEVGIETLYINKIRIIRCLAISKDQYKFNYQTVFSARFDEGNGNNQVLDQTELFLNLKTNRNLTETEIDNIDIRSQLEHQIQIQETKKSGWRFDKINSMTIYFYETVEMSGRSYVKIPLRSAAILNIEKDDKCCLIR